ncbi:calnexin [Jaminaea rosea]|uniref:Calnexin n=1 Tax=Jaminaea rosea TaxID=1569628 RepID=A0A316UZW5_9BASI|nr:calnexin [Jaminaea rosea]PWN30847.1 calnexin [Jaminaea rosea]
MKSHIAIALSAAAAVSAQATEHVERKPFVPTTVKAPFIEQFQEGWDTRWTASQATKEQTGGEVFSYVGKWSVEEPTVFPGLLGDTGLVAKSKAAQHAISAQFPEVIKTDGKPLVVQYETKLQNGLSCGGAYLKLLTESPEGIQAKEFSDKTPYTIMFGPDKCGQTNKVHFIFRHKNPVNGVIEEKHLTDTPYPKLAKVSTLYTLVVEPDNSFEILINNQSRKNGTLFEQFNPSVNPPKEIEDPKDSKPADWVDESRIADPAATKPEDWDEDAPFEIPDEEAEKPEGWLENEPLQIPDPDAKKPAEWDDEEDGEWQPPVVPNPKCEDAPGCGPWVRPLKRNPDYKGKWTAPMIDNPAYKGPWEPRKIPNPHYFEDKHPSHFSPMGGIGFEIWTMDEDILFDNVYVGHSREEAKKLSEESFELKLPIEQNREEKADAEEKASKAAEEAKAAKAAAGSLLTRVRSEIDVFIAAAKRDPVNAIKSQPQVAAGLGAGVTAMFGLLGLLSGLMGGAAGKNVAASASQSKKKEEAAKLVERKAQSSAVKEKSSETVGKRSKKTVVAEDDE